MTLQGRGGPAELGGNVRGPRSGHEAGCPLCVRHCVPGGRGSGHKLTLGAQGTPRPFVLQMGRVRPTSVCGHGHDSHSCLHSVHRTALRLPQPSSGHKDGLQNSHGPGHRAEPTALPAPEGPPPELTGREVKAPQAPPARPALGTKGASA